MKKEVLVVTLIVLIGLMFVSFVHAEIFVSQPNFLYNVGDQFNISVSVSESANSNGFLESKMVCGNGEVELYKSPVSVKANEEKQIEISALLNDFFIGNLTGECFVRNTFLEEFEDSQKFEISNGIDVNLDIQGFLFSPGEPVLITGNAVKNNGQLFNGFYEIRLDSVNLSINGKVENGEFNISLMAPNVGPGNYNLNVKVYEKDEQGDIINIGEKSEIIRIKQVANGIEIILDKREVIPGEELTYKIVINDQINGSVRDDVGVKIYYPNDKIFAEKLIKSDDDSKITTEYNSTPGYWKINVKANGMETEKLFYISSLMSASFEVVNGTLIIKNMGNVPYNKTIIVKIGEKEKLEWIQNIPVNGEKKYELKAEKGTYSVSVADGEKTKTFDGINLVSGHAISLSSLTSKGMIIGWIVLIIVLALVVWYYYKKIRKEKYYGKEPRVAPIKISSGSVISAGTSQSLIENGQKEEAAIVVLKIKNFEEINKDGSISQETLSKMMDIIRQYKGKMRTEREYRTIVFSKLNTNEEDNSMRAIKTAKEIQSLLEDHNKRFTHKFVYGIGAHMDDLIVELKAGQFNFNSAGNSIAIVKRVAENANNEVLLSENIKVKTLSNVKSERTRTGFYKLILIKDKEQHSGFIKNFVERQEDEKKSFFRK